MVWDAEKRGLLKTGMELAEPTSGNTGISRFIKKRKGKTIVVILPDSGEHYLNVFFTKDCLMQGRTGL